MYVDYAFYSQAYGGKVSSEDFTKLEIQASSIVDYHTFNRVTDINDKIRFAVCELIDYLKQLEDAGGKEVSSESVGGYSVTYATNSNTQDPIKKKQRDIILKYLGNTGLMYRGRYYED